MALYTVKVANRFFRNMHTWGLWLNGQQQAEATMLAQKFCEGYAQLASKQASQKWLMFKMRPKYHMFWEITRQNSSPEWALNCLNASTWNDEDFIGRCSRVARTTHGSGLPQALRTIQKVMGQYKVQFQKLNKGLVTENLSGPLRLQAW